MTEVFLAASYLSPIRYASSHSTSNEWGKTQTALNWAPACFAHTNSQVFYARKHPTHEPASIWQMLMSASSVISQEPDILQNGYTLQNPHSLQSCQEDPRLLPHACHLRRNFLDYDILRGADGGWIRIRDKILSLFANLRSPVVFWRGSCSSIGEEFWLVTLFWPIVL